jgi:hypothetical protein
MGLNKFQMGCQCGGKEKNPSPIRNETLAVQSIAKLLKTREINVNP